MATKTPVHPLTVGERVMCPCGGEMRPWQYVEFPSHRRWILWRCETNPDHVSDMVPLPKEER